MQLAFGEEVEVVKAIPGEENRNENSALNRQDTEISDSDQLALESLNEKDGGGGLYKPDHRGHPLPPGRGGLGIQNHPRPHHNVVYHGPPPPLPGKAQSEALDKVYTTGSGGNGENWPALTPDMPKIVSLDVKCEKNLMKVYLSFDKPFYGIVFSKGHYSNVNCVHLPAGLGRSSVNFEISIHACGTAGNTENGLYGYGAESGSGTYFENIIVIQYDPQVRHEKNWIKYSNNDKLIQAIFQIFTFHVDLLDK